MSIQYWLISLVWLFFCLFAEKHPNLTLSWDGVDKSHSLFCYIVNSHLHSDANTLFYHVKMQITQFPQKKVWQHWHDFVSSGPMGTAFTINNIHKGCLKGKNCIVGKRLHCNPNNHCMMWRSWCDRTWTAQSAPSLQPLTHPNRFAHTRTHKHSYQWLQLDSPHWNC